eukprot:Clim_evm24s22 gene=Clim_evmTU24s22
MFESFKKALMGNEINREFQIGPQIASAGPEGLWRIHDGKEKKTNRPCAIWILDKQQLLDRGVVGGLAMDAVLKICRNEIQTLSRVRHPGFLMVMKGACEDRTSLIFATEPIHVNVANMLGQCPNLAPIPQRLLDAQPQSKKDDVSLRYGLAKVAESLRFLHTNAHIVHRNIQPGSLFITPSGDWKIAGLAHARFVEELTGTSAHERIDYDLDSVPGRHSQTLLLTRPDLNFVAPECIQEHRATAEADIFCLGLVLYAFYCRGHSPINCGPTDIESYQNQTRKLFQNSEYYITSQTTLPNDVLQTVLACLRELPQMRISLDQLLQSPMFDTIEVLCLRFLDNFLAKDQAVKIDFLKKLSTVLKNFRPDMRVQKILPPLFTEMKNEGMEVYCLPLIVRASSNLDNITFERSVFVHIRESIRKAQRADMLQAIIRLSGIFCEKLDKPNFEGYVMPALITALKSGNPQTQCLCIMHLKDYLTHIDAKVVEKQIIPTFCLLLETTTSASVQKECLQALIDSSEHLSPSNVSQQILPSMQKTTPLDEVNIVGFTRVIVKFGKQKSSDGNGAFLSNDVIIDLLVPMLLNLSRDPKLLTAGRHKTVFDGIKTLIIHIEQLQKSILTQRKRTGTSKLEVTNPRPTPISSQSANLLD